MYRSLSVVALSEFVQLGPKDLRSHAYSAFGEHFVRIRNRPVTQLLQPVDVLKDRIVPAELLLANTSEPLFEVIKPFCLAQLGKARSWLIWNSGTQRIPARSYRLHDHDCILTSHPRSKRIPYFGGHCCLLQVSKKCEAKYKELRDAPQASRGLTRDDLDASKREIDRFVKQIVRFLP